MKKLRKPALLLILILVLLPVGQTRGVDARNTLTVKRISYYPKSLEETLGKPLRRMLYTRFSPYFDVAFMDGEKTDDPDFSMELSVTKIGESLSIDSILSDRDGKRRRNFVSGERSGDLPHMLERLALSMDEKVGGPLKEVAVTTPQVRPGSEEKGKQRKLPRLDKYLPRGKLYFSPSYSGGYLYFSGGDVNGDGNEDVVAAGEERISVVGISEKGVKTLFTYDLGPSDSVLYISCGDVDRDGSYEAVANLSGDRGFKVLVIDYDQEEEKFRSILIDGYIARVYNDANEGTVLLSQRTDLNPESESKMFLSHLSNRNIKDGDEIRDGRGLSIARAFPIYSKGRYRMILYGRDGLYLKDDEGARINIEGSLDDIRAVDLDRDGSQELMLFVSRSVKGNYFDSLGIKKGFKIEVYSLDENGFFREYSFDNPSLTAGGFFPHILEGGGVNEFVVITLYGNDFFPDSIKWKKVSVR